MAFVNGVWQKLRFRLPPGESILVFDRVGLNWLERIVLPGLRYAVLATRFETYYVTPAVLLGVLLGMRHLPWRYLLAVRFHPRRVRGMFYMLYLRSCIRALRPKVVVTYTDNDWKFQMISRICPGVEFFAVQNGVRSEFNLLHDTPLAPHPANKISMPHLFCFGGVEKDIYPTYGHQVDHFHPVGSIKASYYFNEVAPQRPAIQFDICIVSQWAAAVMLNGAYPEIKRSLGIMDEFLARYLKEHPLRLCVALRESHPEEIAYFNRHYSGTATLLHQDIATMSAYAAIDQSNAVLVLDSTAGREACGFGKRVLFCNFTGYHMYDTPAHQSCFVNQESYEVFRDKLEWLINAEPAEYYARTLATSSYLMMNPPERPAHLAMRLALFETASRQT